jgi:23S rRNA pseudouridine955/2504/2580 synthase
VHPDRDQPENTLIDLVASYIREKEATGKSSGFTPALCHRLDRNTGGLVIIAKNNEALRVMLEKIKNKEVKKYYQCLVKGNIEKPQGILKAYLEKDERKSRVYINNFKTRNSLEIITKYKTLSILDNIISDSSTSLLEVELVTGRTHQIRAHMSYIGHPLIGDPVYGYKRQRFSLEGQMLHARVLGFIHPAKDTYMEFQSDLPEYFQKTINILRKEL